MHLVYGLLHGNVIVDRLIYVYTNNLNDPKLCSHVEYIIVYYKCYNYVLIDNCY